MNYHEIESVGTECLRGEHTCYHLVKHKYTETATPFAFLPEDKKPHEDLYDCKSSDHSDMDLFKLTNGDVVGVSNRCLESYPCQHTFSLNGVTMKWGTLVATAYIQEHNDDQLPEHLETYRDKRTMSDLMGSDTEEEDDE
jgi:hypothetical protein